MGEINVNFGEVEEYQTLPPGNYEVVVDSIELRQSESSQHPYLNWKLKTVDGEFEGSTLYFMTSFSPRALWRMKAVFVSFGIDVDGSVDFEIDDETNSLVSPELVGEPAVAVVIHEEYQGKARHRVDELIGQSRPTSKDELKAPTKPTAPATRPNPFATKKATLR